MKRYIVIGIAILMLGIGFAPPASAVIVTLEFDGTYDITGSPVFGEYGLTPYHYSLEYDTELNTSTDVFLTGALIIPSVEARHDLYGYSSSGITSFDFTFGTKTFTKEDIAPQDIGGWVIPQNDLWFDVAIGSSTPSRAFFVMEDGDGTITIGGMGVSFAFPDPHKASLSAGGWIKEESAQFGTPSSNLTISQSLAPVPEPATLLLLGIGLVGLAGAEVRRRRKKKAVS